MKDNLVSEWPQCVQDFIDNPDGRWDFRVRRISKGRKVNHLLFPKYMRSWGEYYATQDVWTVSYKYVTKTFKGEDDGIGEGEKTFLEDGKMTTLWEIVEKSR